MIKLFLNIAIVVMVFPSVSFVQAGREGPEHDPREVPKSQKKPVILVAEPLGRITDWTRFESGGHPDYLPVNSLYIHMFWGVWHQGLGLYVGSHRISDVDFKYRSDKLQAYNKTAQRMIFGSPKEAIIRVMDAIDSYFSNPDHGGYQMVKTHLCHTYKKYLKGKPNMNSAAIRAGYLKNRKSDSHRKHLLSAISDNTMDRIISEC